jgi:uncharacterized protein (DUF952 family)/GNAT superfamily N-acetyltransferase
VPDVLLHLISPAEWRAALRAGEVAPPSLAEVGFVHLSAPAQVALPAERLFRGRRDLLLLALDPDRLPEVRWEPGVHGDPAAMRFPHAYGPVPAAAVLAVLPYRPRADGGFDAPPPPPARDDHAARLVALTDSLPRRVASTERPVPGGVAVRQDAVPWSHALNQLLVDDTVPAQEIAVAAERELAGRPHRCVTIRGTDPGPVARELGRSGWWVRHEVALAGTPVAGPSGPAEQVTLDEVREVWVGAWRTDLPADDPRRERLPDRFRVDDRGADVRFLAVREAGRAVAAAALVVDGGTALLEAVETDAAHRGRGHANALVDGALTVAAEAGCDLLGLHATAGSWQQEWYARRGFRVVDDRWCAGRD